MTDFVQACINAPATPLAYCPGQTPPPMQPAQGTYGMPVTMPVTIGQSPAPMQAPAMYQPAYAMGQTPPPMQAQPFAPQQYAAQPQVQYAQAPQAQTQAQYVQQPQPQLQQQPQVQYMPQAQATMAAQMPFQQQQPGQVQSPVPIQAPMQYGASQVPPCPHFLICPTLEKELSRRV